MAAPQLSRELAEQAVAAMVSANYVATHAAALLGLPLATYQARLRAAKRYGLEAIKPEPPPVVIPEAPIREPLTSYDEAWTQLSRAIGMAKDRYTGPAPQKPIGKRVRYCAAGDFHIPFYDREAVAELIAREAHQTDVLVIGGDFGDAYSASTFTKYESVPFAEEMAETTACADTLSSAFSRIEYLRGSNHMDRVEKRLRESLDPDLVDAILYMTGGNLSPDLALMKRYPNVHVACWETPQGQRVPWLMVVGDVAFTHAEKYSITPGFATRKVDEWLTDFAATLGLPEIRAVVQFHTHAMSLLPWRADRVLIEPGCMCRTHGYQLGSKIAGRPQRVGYVTFEMEDDRIDFDSIRLRWLNRGGEQAA